jgi:hypothetical protein
MSAASANSHSSILPNTLLFHSKFTLPIIYFPHLLAHSINWLSIMGLTTNLSLHRALKIYTTILQFAISITPEYSTVILIKLLTLCICSSILQFQQGNLFMSIFRYLILDTRKTTVSDTQVLAISIIYWSKWFSLTGQPWSLKRVPSLPKKPKSITLWLHYLNEGLLWDMWIGQLIYQGSLTWLTWALL